MSIKKHYREKMFRLPIYPAEIVFIDTNNEDKLKLKHLVEFSSHSIYAHTITNVIDMGSFRRRRYYIIMDTKTSLNGMGVGCLAHECFHLSNMILDYIGAIPTFENDEPQAYLIQYLVNEGLKFFF